MLGVHLYRKSIHSQGARDKLPKVNYCTRTEHITFQSFVQRKIVLLCDHTGLVLLFQDSSGGTQERVRRPLNAFMLFYQDQLAALKQANQGVGHK